MAEEENHKDAYVRNIRVFKCNNNSQNKDQEFEEHYEGVLAFKTRPRSNIISCLCVRFPLEGLSSLYDEDPLNSFDMIVEESDLFGIWSSQIAREIGAFLKASFRFESWEYDSIVLIIDMANKNLDLDYDEGPTDELTSIASSARSCWGVEMEMEEVKAGMRVTRAKKKEDEEEEEKCSICLTEFNGGEVLTLKYCEHGFHHNCILRWLLKNSSCPNCRSPCLAISV